MEQYILDTIDRRMSALGYNYFDYEPVVVILNSMLPEQKIYSQNEYYFLCTQTLIDGTTIYADNDFLIADQIFPSTKFNKIKEFTGNISISIPQGTQQVLEFLRVIPQK